MKLLDSLLDAIVRLEGDALVMHVGEKPYVVTASSSMNAYRGPLAWGQVELSSRVLTFDAVSSMLGQILPADQQQALTEFGAIEHEIPSPAGVADRFTVVAARGGEDVWVELRRRPTEVAVAAAVQMPAAPQPPAPQPVEQVEPAAHSTTQEAEVAAVEIAPAQANVMETAAVSPPTVETHEPAADVQVHEIEVVHDGEEPAAQVEIDADSSIVVAIPGADAQEIALDAVPDNAIQIVDDEPQDVPTEEEVDAMLAATAGAILTSGMGEVVDDAPVAEAELTESVDIGEESEIELNVDGLEATAAAIVPVAPTSPEDATVADASGAPAFELSPPPLETSVEQVPSEEEPQAVVDAPVGTPLFSEEAVLAAAAPGEGESLQQPPTESEPIPELQANVDAAAHAQPEQSVDSMEPQPGAPSWVPEPQQQTWALQLPAHVEPPVHVEPIAQADDQAAVVPVDVPAQLESQWVESQPAEWQPAVEHAAPVEVTAPIEMPHQAESAHASPVESSEFQAPAIEELPVEQPAFEQASAAQPSFEQPSFEQPSFEQPSFEQPSFDQPAFEEPSGAQAAFEPQVSHDQSPTTDSAVYAEAPVSSQTPQQLEDVTPLDHAPATIAETTSFTPAVVEQVGVAEPDAPHGFVAQAESPATPSSDEPGGPTASIGAVPAFGDQRSAEMSEVSNDANTSSQSVESAASEPMPPIEAPPVSEMTMEVTPELRQQEAPMVDTTGQAAERPTYVSPEPVHAAASSHADAPAHAEVSARADAESHHAVVVPLGRAPGKAEAVAPFTPSEDAALMQTLRAAAARGASTVYVVAQSKPMIRIDGEIGPLEGEPVLTASDVDRLVMELAPPRRREALQNGPVEWLCDVPEIGRVRCLTFRDHRGPGVLFRMIPPRAISADQLGLTPEVQALCQQSDGLVLVTGGRASGKSTLLNSFIDVINRTRSDYLVTIESQIGFVHESRRSFISQRETRGDADLAATYARAALREDPDVMVIEDLKSADLVTAALEAAESGRLVLASVPAASTIAALERLIEVLPADRRTKARSTLATALRGVIAQVLLRRVTGGRAVAREILLNTPAVSQIVLEGKMFQLPVALDSGRRHGMMPLTDSLAAHVRAGTVDVAEAYRKALDRAALVALLKREGFDTSFAERLA